MSKFLVLDLGTEGLRCFVFDLSGRLLSFSRRSLEPLTPPESPWGKEFNAAQVWGKICSAIREALSHAGGVSGIAVTAHRGGMALLDRYGKEIYLGPNLDLRAAAEGLELDSKFGERIYRITGHLPSILFAPAKLLWLRRYRPRDYERVAGILDLGGWLVYRLTGERAMERAAAVELGLADVCSGEWSRKLLEFLELPPDIYPPLYPAGAPFGLLSDRTARELGLSPGIVVTCAGPDTQCGLAGLGVGEGEVGIIAGWSAPAQMLLSKPVFDRDHRTWVGRHIYGDDWVLEANCGEAGGVYRRVKEWLFRDSSFEDLERILVDLQPGAENIFAFLGPGIKDLSRPGMEAGGFFFPLPMFLPDVGPKKLLAATLENLCFALKTALLLLEEISGKTPSRIKVGGGMARSPRFLRSLADIVGREIFAMQNPEATGLGAATCTAVAAGLYPSIGEALKTFAPDFQIIKPDPAVSSEYQEVYHRWKLLGWKLEQLKGILLS